MVKFIRLFLAVASLVSASAEATPQAPNVQISNVSQLAQPLPYPYDEKADAADVVKSAKAKAKREHKRLLIDLGGNWCPDCRVLAGVVERPEMKRFLDRHFVIVTVDIGRFNKNGDIAAHYGITKLQGVPAVLVVDPVKDCLLNQDRLFALADARTMTPQALADWFAQWAA